MDYETIPAEFRDKEWWDIVKTPSTMGEQYFGFELELAEQLKIPYLNEIIFEEPEDFEQPEKPKKPELDTGSSEVTSDDGNFQIQLACHQFKVEDLNVSVENRMVIICGEHGSVREGNGSVTRKFKRCYVLPKNCDVSNIDTSIKDGVLTIKCARSEVIPGNNLNIRVD